MAAPTTAAPAAATTAAPTAASTQTAPQGASGAAVSGSPAQSAPEMFQLKIDGKDVKVSREEMIVLAQQGKVSTQRFQEASKLRQEAEQIMAFAKQNPTEFFKKTGMNAREWAEQFLVNELTVEAMSPEQRKARANEEKLRQYEAGEKQRAEKQKQEALERDTNTHRNRLDLMFTQALNESGLPKTPFTVKRMAELHLINLKNKLELEPTQLAKLVREDFAKEQKALMGGLDGDQLIEFLGPELVKKLSKAQIAKLKARANGSAPVTETKRPRSEGKELSWDQYKARNRGRA